MITWDKGPYNCYRGLAGGVELFSISWRTCRSDPNWIMVCKLPGLMHKSWKDDDENVLREEAEKALADWLERVTAGERLELKRGRKG
jgi:hypothetical protein